MVKQIFLLLFLPLYLFAEEVKITSEIDENRGYEEQPLTGTISITHDEKDKVDETSFLMNKHPLKVELVRTVPVSSTLLIHFYKFTLPPQDKGLKILPAVTAKVGSSTYSSTPSTYEVKGAIPIPAGGPSPTLELKAIASVPKPFYPGQRGKFIYEITFSQNITLSKEVLPLLEAKGMNKVGEAIAEIFPRDHKTVQQLTQIVKADKPGTYTYGPSLIEGKPFKTDAVGKRVYLGTTLKGEAPAVQIEVLPFPEKGKPHTFQGAVGSFDTDVALLSHRNVTIGDTMKLAVSISGKGDLEQIAAPKISCQPGWSGLFSVSDLAPEVRLDKEKKTFNVEFRPLSPNVKEIPPVIFTYFDPKTGEYTSLKSDPIAIEVQPLKKEEPQVNEKGMIQEEKPIEIAEIKPLPPRIETHYNWNILWLIPIGLLLLLLQHLLKQHIKEKPAQIITSKDLFQQALQQPSDSSAFYTMMQKALLTRLAERGEITSPNIDIDQLPHKGFAKDVHDFLQRIEKLRYDAEKGDWDETLKREATDLFDLLEKE